MIVTDKQENPLADLTAKQREVLDLLIQHKTSKEISRILGISPHTVDQRIMLARAKLQVSTRGEVAQAYRILIDTYERSIYEESHVAGAGAMPHTDPRKDEVAERPAPAISGGATVSRFDPVRVDNAFHEPSEEAPVRREPAGSGTADIAAPPSSDRVGTGRTATDRSAVYGLPVVYHPVLPEAFDGPYGTLIRLGYIAAITVFLIVAALGALTMYSELARLADY